MRQLLIELLEYLNTSHNYFIQIYDQLSKVYISILLCPWLFRKPFSIVLAPSGMDKWMSLVHGEDFQWFDFIWQRTKLGVKFQFAEDPLCPRHCAGVYFINHVGSFKVHNSPGRGLCFPSHRRNWGSEQWCHWVRFTRLIVNSYLAVWLWTPGSSTLSPASRNTLCAQRRLRFLERGFW